MEQVPSNPSASGSSSEPGRPGKTFAATGSPSRKIPTFTLIAAIVWLATVVGAMALIVSYSNQAGDAGIAPAQWPAQSGIPLDPARPTLVIFAHPHCPCTRASLGELELLMSRCQGQLSVHIVFVKPAEASEDWFQSDLWRKASAIPGVKVDRDEAGVEAHRFASMTSGQALLYGTNGTLKFQGGITESRGHSGDNAGRSALVDLVENKLSGPVKTPVFGCSLFNNETQPRGTECKQ